MPWHLRSELVLIALVLDEHTSCYSWLLRYLLFLVLLLPDAKVLSKLDGDSICRACSGLRSTSDSSVHAQLTETGSTFSADGRN